MTVSQEVVKSIPYLRRYARALTGNQARGDQYVRVCLEAIIAEPGRIDPAGNVHRQLFAVFHDAWSIFDSAISQDIVGGADEEAIGHQLAQLPSLRRQVLLLVSLEGFSIADTAVILEMQEAEVIEHLNAARAELKRQTPARVLVIEDEPVIAMDIAGIVEAMGHTVVGVAAKKDEAVALAKQHKPGLVLADVQLQDGDSGIVTVQEILESMDAPVVFVTGFPERLLTGDRVEPTFLVTKPFDPETLRVAIGQALSFASPEATLKG